MPSSSSPNRTNLNRASLIVSFYDSQAAFRAALSDSFNTPIALDVLRELVSLTNVYINSRGANLNADLLEYVARWVGQMLRMFGLGENDNSEIGWGQAEQEGGNVNVSQSHSVKCALICCVLT
jgi:cysteinyl-tRNA synthetase